MTHNGNDESTEEKTTVFQTILGFIKDHFWLSLFSLIMMGGGVFYASIYFPELPLYKVILGGGMFGLFSTMCGVGYRLFEIE